MGLAWIGGEPRVANRRSMTTINDLVWNELFPQGALPPKGNPAEVQRSGFGGERSHSGMSELCPQGGANGYGAYGDEGAIRH